MATSTPWGTADSSKKYARGIIFYTTPSHGGFHVSKTLNASMPSYLRQEDGWYEEDCEWAKVVTAFPGFFDIKMQLEAERTLRNWYPDAWEHIHGRPLGPEESNQRRQEYFEKATVDKLVVIAAWGSWEPTVPADMVGVVATMGGKRSADAEEHYYLVPEAEYTGNFIIDPTKHTPWTGTFSVNGVKRNPIDTETNLS